MTTRAPVTLSTHTHVFVPAAQPNARTLIMLHGTGGNEREVLELGRLIDPAAALLAPRGNVLEGPMPRFFRRLREGVFDMDDVVRRSLDLSDWLTLAIAHYVIDPARAVFIGYSNGANILASMMLLRPGPIRHALLLRAMMPLDAPSLARIDPAPSLVAMRVGTLAGRSDPILPLSSAQTLRDTLAQRGADATLTVLETGHNLTPTDIRLGQEFVNHPAMRSEPGAVPPARA